MKHAAWALSVGMLIVGCSGAKPLPAAAGVGDDAPAGGATAIAVDQASPGGASAQPDLDLTCRQKAHEIKAEEGSSHLVRCPAGCAKEAGTVWGTDVYTNDSAICPALVHAGALPDSGGRASVTFVRGLLAYAASERNGVSSQSYGSWRRSFYGQALGSDGRPTGPTPELPDANTARIDCSHQGHLAGRQPGAELIILCPAGCAERPYSVYGSNPYTSDSHACAAAIHAGVVPPGGGNARVTIATGEESYAGSSKNDINTQNWGKYGTSFTVSGL